MIVSTDPDAVRAELSMSGWSVVCLEGWIWYGVGPRCETKNCATEDEAWSAAEKIERGEDAGIVGFAARMVNRFVGQRR